MSSITIEHRVTPAKLDVLYVDDWPLWEKGVSEFDWTYDKKETCYIVEGKAIIWAHWQADIKNIIKEIKKVHGPCSVVDYYGLTPQDQRDKNREAFQNDSEVRFIVGTPQTGGYGITLTAANTVIYYSNGYDLEKRLQSEDRAHRIGQHKPVTYVDILAEETVDEKIVKSLRKKINIASEVLGEELRDWI